MLGVLLAVVLAACAAPPPTRPPAANPSAPTWDEQAFAEHLRVLNGRDEVGRTLGSPGYGYMTDYLRSRMREYMLQPALENRYLISALRRYPTVVDLSVTVVRPDTVRLVPGLDILPDTRSDSVRLRADVVTLVGEGDPAEGTVGPVVVLPAETATTERLRALRRQGAELAMLVGALVPAASTERVPGLGVLRISYQTAVQLLDVPATRLRGLLAPDEPTAFRLPDAIDAVVAVGDVDYDTYSVMGYVAGRHPTRARELVLVCADLEALIPAPDIQVVDFDAFGRSTAALLETARTMARYARFANVPERSLLFAIWLDAADGPDELAGYLRAPLWALERTRAVVYVGLPSARVAEVEALLQPYGIPLHVVPPPRVPLHSPSVLLVPQGPARRAARQADREIVEFADVDVRALVQRGATQALRMAAQLHDIVLDEAVLPVAAQPGEEETMGAPRTDDRGP